MHTFNLHFGSTNCGFQISFFALTFLHFSIPIPCCDFFRAKEIIGIKTGTQCHLYVLSKKDILFVTAIENPIRIWLIHLRQLEFINNIHINKAHPHHDITRGKFDDPKCIQSTKYPTVIPKESNLQHHSYKLIISGDILNR